MESMWAFAAILCGLPLAGAPQDSLESLSRQAREKMLAGHPLEAAKLYEQMLKSLPNEAGLRFNLALALDAAGQPREALKNLEQIRAAEAGNAAFWFLLGIEYQKLQQPAKAVGPLERAVKLDPANRDYRLELADAYLASGASAKAAGSFRALAAERPNDARMLAGLARSQLAMTSDAYQALTQAAPGSSFVVALAALAEVDKGDTAKAAVLYRQALAMQPPAPWLQAERAALEGQKAPPGEAGHPVAQLFARGDFDGVIAQSLAAKNPEVLYWRARAASELARSSLARMSTLPPSAESHELAGLALRQAGRREESLAEFRASAELAPNDNRLRGELAKAYWLSRRYEEAASLLKQIVVSMPDRGDWQFELGDSLFNLGQPELALPHLKRAAALLPDEVPIQAMLGRVLLQTGDSQAAVPVLERAARHDQDGSIYFQLATAYRNLGRADLAKQARVRQQELEAASGKTK